MTDAGGRRGTAGSSAPPAPRWLDDREMATWRSFIQVLFRLPSALDTQLRSDADLTHLQYAVLTVLSEEGGDGVPMSEIARLLAVELSRLSHAVRGLTERGLVRRRPHAEDRRIQVARLTAAGRRAVAAAAPGHVTLVRDLVVDRLTARDLADLERVTAKILSALDDSA